MKQMLSELESHIRISKARSELAAAVKHLHDHMETLPRLSFECFAEEADVPPKVWRCGGS